MTFGNLTVNGGLRYDVQRGQNLPSSAPANPTFPELLPAVEYPGEDEPSLKYDDLQPRISATYALGKNKSTLLRGSYARYADQLGFLPFQVNGLPQIKRLLLLLDGREQGSPRRPARRSTSIPGSSRSTTWIPRRRPSRPTPSTRASRPRRPTSSPLAWTSSSSTDFAVSATYTYRHAKHLQYRLPIGAGPDTWALRGIARGTATAANGFTLTFEEPFYRLVLPEAPTGDLFRNRPGATQTYHGVEFSAVKRLTNRWMLRASAGWNDWTQDIPDEAILDPNNRWILGGQNEDGGTVVGYSGKATIWVNSRWQFNVTGALPAPLGHQLRPRTSSAARDTRSPTTSDLNSSTSTGLGPRTWSTRSTATGSTTSTSSTCGSRRPSSSGRSRFRPAVEVFNVTNEDTVLQRANRVGNYNFNTRRLRPEHPVQRDRRNPEPADRSRRRPRQLLKKTGSLSGPARECRAGPVLSGAGSEAALALLAGRRRSCSGPAGVRPAVRRPPGRPAGSCGTSCSSRSTPCATTPPASTATPRDTTPNLDAFAREGRVFSFAHAHNVITLPSHANILTGLYPYEHGVRDNAGFRLPGDDATLATMLKARGYATAAFVGAFPLDSRYGLTTGFDVYEEMYRQVQEPETSRSSRPGRMKSWRRRSSGTGPQSGKPRFLWVHVYDPHAPYDPPEPFRGRFADAPYLGEVAFTDASLGPAARGRPKRSPAAAARRHRRPRRGHGRPRGAHPRPLCLRSDAPGPPLPLVRRPRPGGTERRAGSPRRHRAHGPRRGRRTGGQGPARPLPPRGLARPGRRSGTYFESLSAAFNRGWAPLRGLMSGRRSTSTSRSRSSTSSRADPREEKNLVSDRSDSLRRLRKRLLEIPTGPVERERDRSGGGREAAKPRIPHRARRDEEASTGRRTIRRT